LRSFLTELGLPAYLKTSGGSGLHVVTPIRRQYDWDTVKDFSRGIVEHLARTLPQLVVAKSGAKNRVGRIYIDYLRNGFGATTVSAWSVRARPGLGVSLVPDAMVKRWGIKGLVIGRVTQGGAADRAGLRGARETPTGRIELGDIVVAVAGKPVTTIDELMAVLEDHKVGEQVTVEILRGNRREKITVTLQAVN
jgi:hypothetical protein